MKKKDQSKKQKKILILNWRDIKNPSAGGAELLTHELAKRFVKEGHIVYQFSSYFKDAKKEEVIDGVNIIREGKPDIRTLLFSVHFKAYRYYKNNLQGKVDLVIDEVHGMPFFTPLYVKEKKIALICEVAGKIWDVTFNFPFNIFGRLSERIYPKLYKDVNIATISESSKEDLVKIGFNNKKISVIPLGCDVPVVKRTPKKNSNPTLIFVGRITKSKGIEDALDVLTKVKKDTPNIHLNIIGRGKKEYMNYLKEVCASKKIDKNTTFYGFVSEKKKISLLEKSHILISPSAKEGWGLTVHEAGARATPAIVYDVEGLREVVKHNRNGLMCKNNTTKELSENVLKVLKNKSLYKKLQKGAIEESRKFTWKKTFVEFKKVIQNKAAEDNRKTIYFYIGTTAELIKLAPVIKELQTRKKRFKIIASGQNEIFFNELQYYLGKTSPDIKIGEKVKKSSIFNFGIWALKTLLKSIVILNQEFKYKDKKNTYFIVHGDTISSLIGAIVAKVYRVQLVHIESGLRSFSYVEPFPEELTRVIISNIADIHFCPNEWSLNNLKSKKGRKVNTHQNTLIESFWSAIEEKKNFKRLSKIKKPYFVLVVHRQEHLMFNKNNTKRTISDIFKHKPKEMTCVLIGHDLTMKFLKNSQLSNDIEKRKIVVLPRLEYLEFVKLLQMAEFIVTDGGSNQEEAYYMGKPCLVLRKRTERVEGIQNNAVISMLKEKKLKQFFNDYRKYKQNLVKLKKRPSEIIVESILNT